MNLNKFLKHFLCSIVFISVVMCGVSAYSQTTLYSTDFDGPETAVVPEGWTQVPGSLHQAASEDGDFDWKAVSMNKFIILDPDSGDQVRDIMGYFRHDAFGAITDSPIGTLFGLERPPLSGSIEWQRMSGCRAPWKNPPYFTGGEQEDGTISDTARVLVADSDEYGGVNLNMSIDSPAVDLQGSNWVRFNYDSFFTANQDQSAGNWYRLDSGPWHPLVIFDNYSHGDDQAYAGPYSFAINTQGASTIQFRFWLTGDFSWFWAVDNLEVVGYNDVPPGPAKPSWLEPAGSMALSSITQFRSSAYSDSTGGSHVFSEWEVRTENESYGDLVNFSNTDWDFLLDYPALRTSIQPNEFAVNAVNPDDLRGSNDQNARSEDPPHEPISYGREQPGAQFQIDLLGDHTVLNLPAHLFRPGTTYFARVRHWNDNGLASPWSDETSFTVLPIASESVLSEDFDGENVYDRLSSAGWDVSWLDVNLGLLQIHGDDLSNFNDTETDGRGTNGHFSDGVLHCEGAFIGPAITPAIDNSNGGALTLIFDSCWRTNVTANVDVLIDNTPTTLLEIGNAQILSTFPDLGNSIPGSVIEYNNTYVLSAPQAAGQANVKFQFDFIEGGGDGGWWTIDNVFVQRGEPVSVDEWQLY